VVDRLEKAGLVRRERDALDRRKVFIAIVPRERCQNRKVLRAHARAMQNVFGSYTDAELRLLLEFA